MYGCISLICKYIPNTELCECVRVADIILGYPPQHHIPKGIEFRLSHVMSCENEEFKQAFILAHHRPTILFPDLLEMGEPSTENVNGRIQHVPKARFLGSGVECDSISSLSQSAASNRGCIRMEDPALTHRH
jgi:hypothetical protein